MSGSISIIDPRIAPEWEAFVRARPDATVFHTAAWCSVLAETYNYPTTYLVSRDAQGRVTGGVALMLVDSWLSRRRLVGLPFSDICTPLLPLEGAEALLMAARDEAGRRKASSVELRGPPTGYTLNSGFANSTTFHRHVIDLDAQLESRVHSSARRAIRKAEREGVTVRVSSDTKDVRRFYELMVTTRRKHGLLPQPFRFFERLDNHFMKRGEGWLLLAELGGTTVAGDLLLRFGDQLVYKFNASDPRYLNLRPNNLLLWKAMQFGREEGCRTLDLGRCEEDNEGLRRFKLLWGSREEQLPYYLYNSGEAGAGLLSSQKTRSALALFVRFAPAFVLEAAGSALYRSFG
jgi:CelD/BcsL family acetyltransferase involved in cellulose biosynthesis